LTTQAPLSSNALSLATAKAANEQSLCTIGSLLFTNTGHRRGRRPSKARGWNELYTLRAFSMFNRAFQIFFFNDYFRQRFPERMAPNPGGGLWLTAAG
jgi:hypothetical protein